MSKPVAPLVPTGTPPLPVAVAEARRQAIIRGDTPPPPVVIARASPTPLQSSPSETAMSSPTPEPPRLYKIVLAYKAVTPSDLGFKISFKARSVDLSDPHFITIDHGPDISLSLDRPAEPLSLTINHDTFDVSWIGTSFRFPERDIFGITLMRRNVESAP